MKGFLHLILLILFVSGLILMGINILREAGVTLLIIGIIYYILTKLSKPKNNNVE